MVNSTCKCLGFDLSTQSLTAIVTDENLNIVWEKSIKFDVDLKEFETKDGVHRHSDGEKITSPVLMWVKALDIMLMSMHESGLELNKIEMISGAAQQHGSVFWKKSAGMTLENLNSNESLCDQLQECFTSLDATVWMDSSTTKQCQQLETVAGGPLQLASITGSKAFTRMTGNQISKVYQTSRYKYTNCERICLVSNFLASLLLGKYSPIDYSDGSGMNLLDINSKKWDDNLLNNIEGVHITNGVAAYIKGVTYKGEIMINFYRSMEI